MPFIMSRVVAAAVAVGALGICGMEMFAATIVSPDPFELAEALAASLEGQR